LLQLYLFLATVAIIFLSPQRTTSFIWSGNAVITDVAGVSFSIQRTAEKAPREEEFNQNFLTHVL